MPKRKSDESNKEDELNFQDKHTPPKRNRLGNDEKQTRKFKVPTRRSTEKTNVPPRTDTSPSTWYEAEIRKLQGTIDHLQETLAKERKAKEDALTRLSSAAASQLRDNNPAIADLSDPNRPLKVTERISELYDNEWTNAMENLEELEDQADVNEVYHVRLLCQILTNSFEMLSKAAKDQLSGFGRGLILPTLQDVEIDKDNTPVLPTELIKPMKDFRKMHSYIAVPLLQKYYKEKLKQKLMMSEETFTACEEYMDECIKWCWIMSIQDPPMTMVWDFKKGDNFDNDVMRAYTKRGDFVNFVVWPVLYLHDGGGLLAKGVVQGMPKSTAVRSKKCK